MSLQRMNDLFGYAIQATDGDIGKIRDCLFDDEFWTIRYLVVDTGNWLSSRLVLISPLSFIRADRTKEQIEVQLTRDEVKSSPNIDTNLPVSRQKETELLSYYRYPVYWRRLGGLTGMGSTLPEPMATLPDEEEEATGDTHLRSMHEVMGYRIEANDGDIGHVSGFILDDDTWEIRYFIVDTSNWLPKKHVLIPPQQAIAIRWESKSVTINLTRDTIKLAPAYEPTTTLNNSYKVRLATHYMNGQITRIEEHRGTPVFSIVDGTKLGTIQDMYLDTDANAMTGVLLVPEGLLLMSQSVIPRDAIKVMGPDAWLISDADKKISQDEFTQASSSLLANDLRGREIETEGGTRIGIVGDILLTDQALVHGFSLKRTFVTGPVSESKVIGRPAITGLGSKNTPMTTILMKAEEHST